MMSEAVAIPDVVPVVAKEKKKVSQNYWSLVWWKFRRNRLAVIGAIILLIYYITCIFFAEAGFGCAILHVVASHPIIATTSEIFYCFTKHPAMQSCTSLS